MNDNDGSPYPYAHWMLREIFEQPLTLRATLALYVERGRFKPESCEPLLAWLRRSGGEIVIAASGSSRHAAMVGETLIEDASGIAVDVEYASEYPYRAARARKEAAVMVVSQSGETADTLHALRKAAQAGHPTLALTNVEGSRMEQEAEAAFRTAAGRERAIPATKSFTAQLMNLYLLSLLAAEARGTLQAEAIEDGLAAAEEACSVIAGQLEGWNEQMRGFAAAFPAVRSFLFLGRGVHYPVAREGALKLKESAYLHAEGYPTGELKHGPNALVGKETALVILATHDPADAGSVERYERTLMLLAEMQTLGAEMLAIVNQGDARVVRNASTRVLEVTPVREPLMPLCEVIPLQMFAYHMALKQGVDVDRPRNLTKAVLTE